MRSKTHGASLPAAVAALMSLLPTAASAIPFRAISGLESITFWERSGGTGPSPSTFAVDGPELTVRLGDPLGGASNFDSMGVATESRSTLGTDARTAPFPKTIEAKRPVTPRS